MSAEVSRALAQFVAALNLGPEIRAQLLEEYGGVENVTDLPEWLTDDPRADTLNT